MAPASHHPMASPSFASTSRHPAPSQLSGWDSDRQDRSAFVNGAAVAVAQFTNHERPGHWPPSDGRINMGSNGLTHNVSHVDYMTLCVAQPIQTLQNAIPITTDFMHNPQMSVNRGRKHGRDWAYGELEGDPSHRKATSSNLLHIIHL